MNPEQVAAEVRARWAKRWDQIEDHFEAEILSFSHELTPDPEAQERFQKKARFFLGLVLELSGEMATVTAEVLVEASQADSEQRG
jgi:hypothetical protein